MNKGARHCDDCYFMSVSSRVLSIFAGLPAILFISKVLWTVFCRVKHTHGANKDCNGLWGHWDAGWRRS